MDSITTFGEAPHLLNPGSEMMALSNYADAMNVAICGFDLEGYLDGGALKLALAAALKKFPEVVSSVTETMAMGTKRLVWVSPSDLNPSVHMSDLDLADPAVSFQEALFHRMADTFAKEWDLFRAMPTEFHVFRASEKRHTFVCLHHHAALDGWQMCGFLKTILETYHELVTGQQAVRVGETPYASSFKGDMVDWKSGKWRDLLFVAWNSVLTSIRKASMPKGSGDPHDPGEHCVKFVLTEAETQKLLQLAEKKGTAVVDLLAAGLCSAVDRWNAALSIPPGFIKIGLPVQMRGRFGSAETPVNISFILVTSRPADRRDPDIFARCLAESRMKQFRDLADVKAVKAGQTLAEAFRLLPLKTRQRMVHAFWQLPMAPMLISSFGVMWPEVQDGRPTGRSSLTRVGGVDVTEVHVMGYKHAPWTPLRIYAYTFRSRLNLLLWVANSHFVRAESEKFINIMVEGLRDDPFRVSSPS